MANIKCCISGLSFQASFFGTQDSNLYVPITEGYFHPIFAAPNKALYTLYSKHAKNMLTKTESYLLYLAFLHSSEKVLWNVPASLDPKATSTTRLIENTFSQLINVIQQTNCIVNPAFHQPSYRVSIHNSDLASLPNYIEAWEDNLTRFKAGIATQKILADLARTEAKLQECIYSSDPPAKYASVIASWADKAAEFPADKKFLYIDTIKACFNEGRMIRTPLALLKEIKEYCECNIEAGSIHFHALMDTLTNGIKSHMDYLGGSSLALGYTLLDLNTPEGKQIKESELKTSAALAQLTEQVNLEAGPPDESRYATRAEYIKAKLAYMTAKRSTGK